VTLPTLGLALVSDDRSPTSAHEAPPLVSYAQNREDLFLWALLAQRTPGFYVDVGCNHERLHSVTRLFYERGWSGINIDANPKMAAEFGRRNRDISVVAGVGESDGQLEFREYPLHDGLSTFDDDVKAFHEPSQYPHIDHLVRVRTLSSILDEFDVDRIDYLKIDVEGLEAAVLRGLDLDRYRPTVVVVEASRAEECADLLLPRRYRLEFFDGLNVYYVDDDAVDVSIHNYAGRVLHCGFRTDTEQQLVDRLNRAEDRLSDCAGLGGAKHRLRREVSRWSTRWSDSVRPRVVRRRAEWSARRRTTR
jgi:FkbM family methyltransferase